ncbi:MAG: sigma-70 family RNA polymerase sigma factor [Planctomycetes bacterium]|nr:sigma-70 family RNA polymerase sigma factor [Planctomycetota bacterium]
MDDPTALFDRYRRSGDIDALGRAFDLLAPRLLAMALHLTGNAADAEDVLQATFVVAMQKATVFDPQQRVGPWLCGVLAGEANNLRRREQRRRTEVLGDVAVGDADVVSAAERRELVARVRTRIDALPEEQRQVLLLQLQHGLQPAEIAEVLGLAPGTVRMRLHRGLDALRRVLPAGLVALAVAGSARRGLAAVREAVLQAGAQHVAVAGGGLAATLIGGIMLKKVLVAVGVLAAGLLVWRTFASPGEVAAPTQRSEASTPVGGQLGAADDRSSPRAADAAAIVHEPAVREPVDQAPGTLQVTVRGHGPFGDDPFMVDILVPEPETGPVLPGVVVEVSPATRERRAYDTRHRSLRAAGRDGRCSFEGLSPGSWRVEVESGGMLAEERVELVPGESASIELFVELAGTLRGRVVDEDGRAVGGAELWIGGRMDAITAPQKVLRCAATSAADGSFAVPFRRQEEYVCARLAGFATSPSYLLRQLGDGPALLVLGRQPCAVTGVLVDDVGRPVADAQVTIEPIDASHRDPRRGPDGTLLGPRLGAWTRSDARGAFSFEGLSADAHALRAVRSPNEVIDTRLTLAPGERRDLRFTMARRSVVAGRVLRSDGRPCTGVYVALCYDDRSSHTDITDGDGAFRFEGVSLRSFELIARRSGSQRDARRSMPAPSTDGVEIDLVYDELPQLRGRVRAVNGLMLGNWFVTAGDGGTERREPTDAQGRFCICDVAAGTHTVRVHRLGDQAGKPVLTAQIETDVEADLRVPLDAMPFGEVRGRVVGAGGAPLDGWMADIPGAGFKEGPPPGELTFRFSQLLPGGHWLRIVAPEYVVRQVPVDLHEGEQLDLGTIELVPSGSLRVHFEQADGSPWRARPPTPWLSSGPGRSLVVPDEVRYTVDGDDVVATGIAPGTYSIHGNFNDELLMAPTTVTVAAGEERRVTVPLTIGRRCTFVLSDLADVADSDGSVQVVVGAAAGAVVYDERVRLDEGRGAVTVVVPPGAVTVEARAGGAVVAQCAFAGAADLASGQRVAVPRVR